MIQRRSTFKPASLLFCLVLAACGGGGDGTSGSTASGLSDSTSTASTGGNSNSNGSTSNTGTSGNTGSTGNTNSSGNSSDCGCHSGSGGSTGSSGGGTSNGGGSGSTSSFQYDTTARFNTPTDLTIDTSGNLYVIDSGNQVIRKVAANGQVSTLPGTYPAGTPIAIDPSGNLIALLPKTQIETDSSGNPTKLVYNNLYRITPTDGSQTLIYSFPNNNYGDFTPVYISTDSQGRIYLLGYTSGEDVTVIEIDADNVPQTIFSGVSHGDIRGISSDALGNVVIGSMDYDVGGVVRPDYSGLFDIPLSKRNSTHGSGGETAPNRGMPMNYIQNIVNDADGNTYVVDVKIDTSSSQTDTISNLRILKVTPSGTVTTILNGFPNGKTSYTTTAGSGGAFGLALGADGNLYVSDPDSDAIYKVTMSGQATLIAGKEGEAGSSD